jgi:hypothetical protein
MSRRTINLDPYTESLLLAEMNRKGFTNLSEFVRMIINKFLKDTKNDIPEIE